MARSNRERGPNWDEGSWSIQREEEQEQIPLRLFEKASRNRNIYLKLYTVHKYISIHTYMLFIHTKGS